MDLLSAFAPLWFFTLGMMVGVVYRRSILVSFVLFTLSFNVPFAPIWRWSMFLLVIGFLIGVWTNFNSKGGRGRKRRSMKWSRAKIALVRKVRTSGPRTARV